MKIIEALKKVKANREKIGDLQSKVKQYFAHMERNKDSIGYKDPKAKVAEWVQSIKDLELDNARLLARIQKTNLETTATVELDNGVQVTKTLSEWITRRREGVDSDITTYRMMQTNLKPLPYEENGVVKIDNVVYNFDIETRDKRLAALQNEKYQIDSVLEIVNATTDLMEL